MRPDRDGWGTTTSTVETEDRKGQIEGSGVEENKHRSNKRQIQTDRDEQSEKRTKRETRKKCSKTKKKEYNGERLNLSREKK